jgi:hypothetical protein
MYNTYRVFPGVKSGRGVTLTSNPILVPWSRKSKVILILPLWAVRPVKSLSACTRVYLYIVSLLRVCETVSMVQYNLLVSLKTLKVSTNFVDLELKVTVPDGLVPANVSYYSVPLL